MNVVPRLTRSQNSAWDNRSRREVLTTGVAVAGGSLLNVRASAAGDMPNMPRTELADGLSISQVI